MKFFKIVLTSLIVLVAFVSMTASISAAEISYQGMLTDGSDDPVPDGGYSIHVAFFDDSIGGTKLWEETHLNVQLTDGRFSMVLGRVVPVEDGWYGGASAFDVWMEVDVNEDGPVSPRTLMTSMPQAMNAYRVTGDIRTMPGQLELYPPEPGAAGGSGFPAFRLNADSLTSGWKLYPPGATGPDDTCGGMGATVDIELVALQLNSDWTDPCDSLTGIKLIVDSSKARMILQKHANGSYVDIASNIGPSIVMMEPTSMTGINLGASPGEGGLIAMASKSSASNDSNSVELTTSSSGAGLNISHRLSGAADIGSTVEINSGPSSGASIYMHNPQAVPPAGPEDAAILFNTTPGSGASMYMFNPQPEPPATPWLAIGTDVGPNFKNNIGGNIGLLMFNPQPEPPADPQLEMYSDALGGRFKFTGAVGLKVDGNSALQGSAETAEAVLSVARDYLPPFGGTDSNKVEIRADASRASLTMFGGPTDSIAEILMTANATEGGRIGINTNNPSEALYVVGNIVATGLITALTETKVKTNIETVEGALDKVSDLRGVTYDMKRDEYPELRFSDKRQLGFLAEEVAEVVPEVVLQNGDNLKSVDYGRLTPLLVEAIKELRQQNEQLMRRIERLEAR